MEILDKVVSNIRSQSILRARMEKLNVEMAEINQQSMKLSGQMEVFLELYREQTGHELQADVNTNENLKRMIAAAQQEGIKIAGGINDSSVPIAPRVEPQQSHVVENPRPPIKLAKVPDDTGRKPPVRVVIEDGPPPGPGKDVD